MNINNKVKEIVATTIDCNISEIKDSSRIIDDLGADSLDIYEIVDHLEKEFNVELDNYAYSSVKGNTIESVVELINTLINNKNG
jgi:acyl carrier protein